jgi:hypothetical protein
MGPRLLVAVPDRDRAYVFPRSLETFRRFGAELVGRYEEAVYPCSLELFEVSAEGIRAIGTFAGGSEAAGTPGAPQR